MVKEIDNGEKVAAVTHRLQQITRMNSLSSLVDGVFTGLPYSPYGNTLSQPWTLAEANSYTPLTLNRILLSYSFMTQGLVQTIVTQPVDDAFRGGFQITSDELDEEEIATLLNTIKRPRSRSKFKRPLNPNALTNPYNSDIRVMMDTMNWGRLYGGAGLIINTDQDFRSALDPDQIGMDSNLEFIAADRWELILSQTNVFATENPTPYNYYGYPLNASRVIRVLGTEAPSYIRQRLQGWGMSQIESCIRPINAFVKFENLIFELLDEAKVDVYKIQGFNDQLISDESTANVAQRVNLSNKLKNTQNALAMDAEDDYMQKQITWSGLAEIWDQLRTNLSSALKIPKNKLFGDSATGFGGGQDSMENYNTIVEQVRQDAEPLVMGVIDLRCQQLFGYVPEYVIAWKPLKLLDEKEEEEVKTMKQKRAVDLFTQRLVTGQEVSRILTTDGLLNIETEVSKGLREVEPTAPNDGDPSDKAISADKDKTVAAAKAKPKPAARTNAVGEWMSKKKKRRDAGE